jgi:protease I
MEKRLENVRIAILATDGFEESELTRPAEAWRGQGAQVSVVAPKGGTIRGWRSRNWGADVPVDVEAGQARVDEFDALFLPGGVINPDSLRLVPRAVEIVKEFFKAGKPVAAICHGPQLLIEADEVRGRTLTSWPSLKTDIRNAAGHWVDEEVVVDGNLVTSRKPDDIPAFCDAAMERFSLAVTPAPVRGKA